MKKQNIIIGAVVVIVIIIIAVVIGKNGNSTGSNTANTANTAVNSSDVSNSQAVTPAPVPLTVTATSSNGITQYTNNELGFSVNYPSAWTVLDAPSGPSFTIPLTSSQNSIATLAASIYTTSGACAFPTLGSSATTKQSKLSVGKLSFNVLSVSNTASGLNYTDKMYTLQQGSGAGQYCYVFAFGAISKKDTSDVTTANNTSIVTKADTDFTSLVKSFAFVTGPAGQSESAHPNGN